MIHIFFLFLFSSHLTNGKCDTLKWTLIKDGKFFKDAISFGTIRNMKNIDDETAEKRASVCGDANFLSSSFSTWQPTKRNFLKTSLIFYLNVKNICQKIPFMAFTRYPFKNKIGDLETPKLRYTFLRFHRWYRLSDDNTRYSSRGRS